MSANRLEQSKNLRGVIRKDQSYHDNELRTLDFFDAETGELLYQHHQSGFDGILSLNRFNILGDALASSYGQRFLIWKPNFKHLEKIDRKKDKGNKRSTRGGGSRGRDSDDGDDDDDDDDIDWKAHLKAVDKEKKKQRNKKEEEVTQKKKA